ncbi:MAG: hypothetical protein F4114_06040 [Rhodospirillaceae bacterium]|nr:hypothetical protein [Rhodospirillaceae bacterium]MYB11925.1 hypothetical protein [Rhodospirillaceae bacterium]MYI48634.1 hypothetical protein [Rhodospirillaceae bacterium]
MKPISLVAAIASALTLYSAASVAQTKITYGSWAPSSDPASLGMKAFTAEVGKQSGGKIQVVNHFDSSVVQMRTVLNGIRDSLVDAGYIAGAIYQAELPIDSMITSYASIQANPLSISAAVTDFVLNDCPECRAEVAKRGVTALAYAGTPPFYLMCKAPVTDFSQVKGKSIRAASAYLRFVRYIGATPVNTPTVEVMEAMRRGQVACLVGSIFWLQAYSLWDVVKYVVDVSMGQYNNGLVFGVNTAFWKKLNAADRAAIVGALPTLVVQAAAAGNAKAQSIRKTATEKGIVWAKPNEKMAATIQKWFAGERKNIEDFGKKKGIANAGAILDRFEASVAKWNGIVSKAGGDAAAVQAALTKEVYAKMK